MTLIIGIPILQQLLGICVHFINFSRKITAFLGRVERLIFLGLKIYLANADESKTSFLRRTSPSLPKVMVHITPRKHSLLIKGFALA
jgi:hypothetical protein